MLNLPHWILPDRVIRQYFPGAHQELLAQNPCPLPPTTPTSDSSPELIPYSYSGDNFAASRVAESEKARQLETSRNEEPMSADGVGHGGATYFQMEQSTGQLPAG
jgi:hypothetical protein